MPIQVPTGSESSDAAKSGKSRHQKHQSRAERHEQTERRSDNPPFTSDISVSESPARHDKSDERKPPQL